MPSLKDKRGVVKGSTIINCTDRSILMVRHNADHGFDFAHYTVAGYGPYSVSIIGRIKRAVKILFTGFEFNPQMSIDGREVMRLSGYLNNYISADASEDMAARRKSCEPPLIRS